jgi:tetratricopeptide (TPR) repeat protein
LPDAAEAFRRAIEVDPTSAQAHYNLGTVLIDLGENDRAIAELQEALRLKPDFLDARRELEELRRK